jgi:hypothetical protein
MALTWFALSVQWMGLGEWAHATVTSALGLACYAAGERFQKTI